MPWVGVAQDNTGPRTPQNAPKSRVPTGRSSARVSPWLGATLTWQVQAQGRGRGAEAVVG